MDSLTASSKPVSRLRFMNLFSAGIIALMYPTGPFWHCFMHPILSYRDLYPLGYKIIHVSIQFSAVVNRFIVKT